MVEVRKKNEAVSWAESLLEVLAALTACSTVQTRQLVLQRLSEIRGDFVYAKMKLQAWVIVGESGQEHSAYGLELASGRLLVHFQSRSQCQSQVPKKDGLTVLVAWEVVESAVAILVEEVMDCSHL